MTIFLRAARLALPTLFFGYGIFANLAVLYERPAALVLPDSGILAGGLTRDLDSLYKRALPHVDLSFGLIGAARFALLGEARQGAIVGQDGWLFSAEEVRPMPSDADLASMVEIVEALRTQLRADGVDLVVVPLPAKIDIYRDKSPDTLFGASLEVLYADVSADLAARGITFVDARSALLKPSEPVFFTTDTHWTPHGAHLVAEQIAKSGTIGLGTIAFHGVVGVAKPFTGDLVKFVTSAVFAPDIGLLSETVTPVLLTATNAEADIFSVAPTDIVLVGTSYSANTDWGFVNALMQTLGRDIVSVAEQGHGPLKPMQSYIASADYRDAPPAVVIWEIPIRYMTDPSIWMPAATAAATVAALPSQENSDG